MGVVLLQEGHPISYYSKTFCAKLQNLSTYVRELHNIIATVKKWRHYSLGNKFITNTDQKSLKVPMSQVVQTPYQHYYLTKLLGYFLPSHTNEVEQMGQWAHYLEETP